jgi:hypothetical protein
MPNLKHNKLQRIARSRTASMIALRIDADMVAA